MRECDTEKMLLDPILLAHNLKGHRQKHANIIKRDAVCEQNKEQKQRVPEADCHTQSCLQRQVNSCLSHKLHQGADK